MTSFTVRWEENIDADSPTEAVTKARALLADNPGLVFFTITNDRGDEMELDLATGTIRYTHQIPEHTCEFVGDQDTCVVYAGCPITWGAWRASQRKHAHHYKYIGSYPSGPDETTTLRRCDCGDQKEEEHPNR